MTTPISPAPSPEADNALPQVDLARRRTGLILTVIGFLIFILGAKPAWLGLDRSPVIGFVQIAAFTVGLGLVCLGGYIGVAAVRGGQQRSIPADIGLRLVSTGYVIVVFAGMADVFGLGSHPMTVGIFFGPWQARGVEIGELIIAIGFLMLMPPRQPARHDQPAESAS